MRKGYLITAPGWTHISSGPRALHLLCHYLNQSGEDAYILPQQQDGFALNPQLNTKIISQEYANFYGENMVVIYPDVVRGNPTRYLYVCRWLLAPAGQYGGDTTFPETDKIWCFRSDIAEMQNTDKVLCLPTFDDITFVDTKSSRSGTCYYSHKYDRIHNNALPDIVKDSIRLEGSPEYIASILQKSEKMYLLEPSEIKIHSLMCGCPVEEVISPYFQGMGTQRDFLQDDGRVRTMSEMRDIFALQLGRFIEDTQTW